jgi:hypothetical protein
MPTALSPMRLDRDAALWAPTAATGSWPHSASRQPTPRRFKVIPAGYLSQYISLEVLQELSESGGDPPKLFANLTFKQVGEQSLLHVDVMVDRGEQYSGNQG